MSSRNGKALTITDRFQKEKREFQATHQADYEMSRPHRSIRERTGLAPQGGTADYHYRSEPSYYRDIEKVRAMERDDDIVGMILTRAVNNIVQDGFILDPQTGDTGLDDELFLRWSEWSSDDVTCDLSREFTWHDIEMLSLRSMLRDGDYVAMATNENVLQLFEAHTIQTNTRIEDTFLGVTLNENSEKQQFHILTDQLIPNQGSKKQSMPIDVRDEDGNRQVFQVYNPDRSSLTRGVTAFHPIFKTSGMFEDINFATLLKQQIASFFAIIEERAMRSPGDNPPSTDLDFGKRSTETTTNGTRYIEGLGPGAFVKGDPGSTLKGFAPDIPGSSFFEHATMTLRLIAANLGLPLIALLLDASETNYSGWRGANNEAQKGYISNQRNLKKRLHCPTYRWQVREYMKADPFIRRAAARNGINVFGHSWNTPRWQSVDQEKDSRSNALRLQTAQTSPRRLHSEMGQTWFEIADETIADNEYAIVTAKQRAAEINRQFPDQPVLWRELINLPMPAGFQMTMQDPTAAAGADNLPDNPTEVIKDE